MIALTLYTFEDGHGREDGYRTFDVEEAKKRAQRYGFRVLANKYECTAREVAWDFTPPERCCTTNCLKPAKTNGNHCHDHDDENY